MSKRTRNLLLIIPLAIIAALIAIPTAPIEIGSTTITTHLGLDLVGGVQALMEADLPENAVIDSDSMNVARTIIENRANGLLGVGEAVVQLAGNRRIVIELPGETDPEAALAVLGETGQLEFVDMSHLTGDQIAALRGSRIVTDFPAPPQVEEGTPIFHTVMVGSSLQTVNAQQDTFGQYGVSFELDSEGTTIFREYTQANTGGYLAIVLDKTIISIPRVETAITSGRGVISGSFTPETANELAIQLRSGSLPIPLVIVESRTIGPSLGQDSLQKSLVAGMIGLGVIALFMMGYYRLPGIIADLALLVYVVMTFALFKLIPVTLTLPGIAGFVLSLGVAVDANILIFERMKEELREGRVLNRAIDLGWDRAWPSIRDSNIATLITCGILFWFGSAFGASVVKGFAVTLSLGIGVSLFTAIVVTRSFLHLALDNIRLKNHTRWFGL